MTIFKIDPLQPYRNRDYQLHHLDQSVFDAANESGDPGRFAQFSGCIDALDSIPAGSTSSSPKGQVMGPTYITRAVSLEELRKREEIAKKIIAMLSRG
jgi:hypothetical protein